MGDARQLSRTALRRDQIVQVELDRKPEPPPAMMKLPGVAEQFAREQLWWERVTQSLHHLVGSLTAQVDSVVVKAVQAANEVAIPGPQGIPGPAGADGSSFINIDGGDADDTFGGIATLDSGGSIV